MSINYVDAIMDKNFVLTFTPTDFVHLMSRVMSFTHGTLLLTTPRVQRSKDKR